MAARPCLSWCAMSGRAEDAAFVSGAMTELRLALADAGAQVEVGPLGAALAAELIPLLEGPAIEQAVGLLEGAGRARVVVYTEPTHPVARAAQGRLAHARWGLSVRGLLSLVYVPGNKYLLWHEALHLLGVEDHYDVRTLETTCGVGTCVMQYAPSGETVREGAWWCEGVLARMRGMRGR